MSLADTRSAMHAESRRCALFAETWGYQCGREITRWTLPLTKWSVRSRRLSEGFDALMRMNNSIYVYCSFDNSGAQYETVELLLLSDSSRRTMPCVISTNPEGLGDEGTYGFFSTVWWGHRKGDWQYWDPWRFIFYLSRISHLTGKYLLLFSML
jgi:hypothetical protein